MNQMAPSLPRTPGNKDAIIKFNYENSIDMGDSLNKSMDPPFPDPEALSNHFKYARKNLNLKNS